MIRFDAMGNFKRQCAELGTCVFFKRIFKKIKAFYIKLPQVPSSDECALCTVQSSILHMKTLLSKMLLCAVLRNKSILRFVRKR